MLDEFEEFFEYRNGKLYWKKQKRGRGKVGEEVGGSISRHGYRRMMFNYKEYNICRIIFYLHHKIWPEYVDHINGDKLDDRIENLRAADRYQNQANTSRRVNNKTGYKGVIEDKRTGKFMAKLMNKNKLYSLGSYNTAEEAAMAYDKKAIELQGEFARLNLELDV